MSNQSRIPTFDSGSIEDHTLLLASHMPKGRFWEACFDQDTNFGKLIKGLALEYYRIGVLTEEIAFDYDIRQTSDFLIEWEDSCGIPQRCFSRNRSLSQRRVSIEGLFSNFGGAQTNEDFVRVGLLYNYIVEVYAGIDVSGFDMMFPIILFDTKKYAKNTLVINLSGVTAESADFPLEYPIPFYGFGVSFLSCIFDLITPATCDLILTTQFN